ncbi:hypothetical protein IQ254_26915 [Nodosilinea sp. LEGE 07088]|uniref:hypothetical protein n=1 Tax=Nodosilinea sp. LEGE 07088 TaxID=2777968 RepID=UPI0018803F56|nr:hypothetical protein [Nodosilinea sp. LEGE 07088]MBE9140787.1 hypothetical protein [Nodosilinea sp. LEGE 07088]
MILIIAELESHSQRGACYSSPSGISLQPLAIALGAFAVSVLVKCDRRSAWADHLGALGKLFSPGPAGAHLSRGGPTQIQHQDSNSS